MLLYQIIKQPLITEKTMLLANQGKYTFLVDIKANKSQVKKAVAKLFKVEVRKVNLYKLLGRKKRAGRLRKKIIKNPDRKKAVVQLKPGQKIEFFEELGKSKK